MTAILRAIRDFTQYTIDFGNHLGADFFNFIVLLSAIPLPQNPPHLHGFT